MKLTQGGVYFWVWTFFPNTGEGGWKMKVRQMSHIFLRLPLWLWHEARSGNKMPNEYRCSWRWNIYSRDHHVNTNTLALEIMAQRFTCFLQCMYPVLSVWVPGLGNEMREKVWLTACQHSQHITIQLILCTLRENLWRPLIVLVSRMM